MPSNLMGQTEYARHRGKSKQWINRLAKSGVLVMRGGKIDVAASDAVLDDRPDTEAEKVAAPAVSAVDSGLGVTTFAQARTAEMILRARLRKLEYDLRVGKLVEAEVVTQRWSAILRVITERVLAWPNRIAPELAAITDERRVREVVMLEARTLLDNLRVDVKYAR